MLSHLLGGIKRMGAQRKRGCDGKLIEVLEKMTIIAIF